MENRSKYNVDLSRDARVVDDTYFASGLERRFYYEMIVPAMDSGEITYCERQKPFELIPKFTHDGMRIQAVNYIADFYIIYRKDGEEKEIVVDTKGFARPEAILKRKLFWVTYPDLRYEWISYSEKDGGWIKYEDLQKVRRMRKRLKNIKG